MASKRQWGKAKKSKRAKPMAVPSWFRRMLNREVRAKRKQALREGKDPSVILSKEAYWEYW